MHLSPWTARRRISRMAWKYQAVGSQMGDQFSLGGPTGAGNDNSASYKKGFKKVMRLKKPKARKVPPVRLLEMEREEIEKMEPHEAPVDNQKVESTALIPQSDVPFDVAMPGPGIELETDPHRPQRRVFRTFQNFDKLHYPAASQADMTPSHYYKHYRDFSLGKYENQLTLPRMTGLSKPHRTRRPFGHSNEGLPPRLEVSPSTYLGAHYFVQKARDTYTWDDPMATTFDMKLDEPTNPLLSAPHSSWESLPLSEETLPPDQLRIETGETTIEVDGQEMTVSPNQEVDVFPVSIHPTPGKYSKQYGMPMQKIIGPIQWEDEEWKAEKLHRAEKMLTLQRDESKAGQDMKILCIGDTLTLGFSYGSDQGVAYKSGRNLYEERDELELREHPYASRLHELTNANIDVLGVARDTVFEMRDRLWRRLNQKHEEGDQYDLVIIWGGIYDLMDPLIDPHEVAKNLQRMHHISHMHGCKTVALTLPRTWKSYSKIVTPGTLAINKELEEFSRDRRKNMTLVDIFKMMPYRSVPNFNFDSDAKWLGKIGAIYNSGAIEMTPAGYNRVAELIFKQLKHKPGFFNKAIPSRFYDHPTPIPNNSDQAEFMQSHYDYHLSRRATLSNPDSYGSTVVNKQSSLKVIKDDPIDALTSEDYAKQYHVTVAQGQQVKRPVLMRKKHIHQNYSGLPQEDRLKFISVL